MGNYGTKASLDGVDIKDATVDQLAQTSKYASLKIKLGESPAHFGNTTITSYAIPDAQTTTIFSVQHSLGYIPAHFCLVSVNDGFSIYTNPLPHLFGAAIILYSECTDDYFYIKISNYSGSPFNTSGYTLIFKYYIFSNVST